MPAFGRGRGRHEAAEEVREKLGRFAGRPRFNDEFEEAFEFFFGESVEHLQDTLDQHDFDRFMEWFIYDYRLANGHRLIEVFDLEHGADLSRPARRILREWEQSHLTLFELQQQGEETCRVLDVLTGRTYDVSTDSVSVYAQRWSLIISRALPIGKTWELSMSQTLLPPLLKEPLINHLRGEYRRYVHLHGETPLGRFLREQAFIFNDLLEEIEYDESAAFLEGDESYRLLHCRALYSTLDEEKVMERLLAYDDIQQARPGRMLWYDAGDKEREGLIAEMHVTGGRLHLHCWSKERLDIAKNLLDERMKGLVWHLVDAYEELQSGNWVPADERSLWMNAAYSEYVERWQSQPLSALDGKAPRFLTGKKLGRIRLAELLKKLEYHHAGGGGRYYDVARELRRQLGIADDEGLVSCLDRRPAQWNDASEEKTVDVIDAMFPRHGLSEQHADAAVAMWWDYCYRAYPRVRKPEAWAAALHYAIGLIEGWDVTQEEIASLYAVTAATVSQNSRKLIDCLDVHAYDDRYCVEHPVDGLLERLGRMYFREDEEKVDPTTFGLALAARMREEIRAATVGNESLRERAGDIFYSHVGCSPRDVMCQECFSDWFHFDWRVPVMGGRTLVKAALEQDAFEGEAKNILEAWSDCHPGFYVVEGIVEGGSVEENSAPPRMTLRDLVGGTLTIVDWLRVDEVIPPKALVFARLVPLGGLTISLGPVITLPASRAPIVRRLIEEDRTLVNRWNDAYIEWDEYRSRYAERLYAMAIQVATDAYGVEGNDD